MGLGKDLEKERLLDLPEKYRVGWNILQKGWDVGGFIMKFR